MGEDYLGRVLRRDRMLVAGCLITTTSLAAIYILTGAGMGMSAADMTHGMDSQAASTMRMQWSAAHTLLMFTMWWIMMIAMMLPSATPTILLSAALNRRSQADTSPFGSAAVFTLGYLLAWALFSLAAVGLQWLLERAGMLSMHMASNSTTLSACLLIAAGAWQLSPIKNACLTHCRSPVDFLTKHRKPGNLGALQMGLHHGFYCLGCCWFLMVLLYAGGIMNLYWIVGLAVYVYAEKVLSIGKTLAPVSGVALIIWGLLIWAS